MKIRKLHIADYKMFKDFDISFVDEKDKALPIIVLAGVNGSGKTTLLKLIKKLYDDAKAIPLKEENYLEFLLLNMETNKYEIKKTNTYSTKLETVSNLEHNTPKYPENIFFFLTNTTLENIKTLLPKYIEDLIFVKGVPPFDSYKKVTAYMNEILKELTVEIEFDSRDGEGNLFFRNKSGGDKFSIDELSTGEKTLMSKVLYLYLEDIRDKVILIDEPELSLHPSWQNKVLKIYENFALNNNCQIIIATHSPHIIASAKNEYLRFLVKEDNKIVVKQLNDSPLNRDMNTILKTLMGANYKPQELEELQLEYREFFDEGKLETEEAKEVEKKILKYESLNSAFFQGIAFDKALME